MRFRALTGVVLGCLVLVAVAKREGMTRVNRKVQDVGPTTTSESEERQDRVSAFLADHGNARNSRSRQTTFTTNSLNDGPAEPSPADEKASSLQPPKNTVKGAYIVSFRRIPIASR